MKFKFEGTHMAWDWRKQAEYEDGKVIVEKQADSLSDALEAFQSFLAGCGYAVKYGEIQFICEDDVVRWATDNVDEDEPSSGSLLWKDVDPTERSVFAPEAEEDIL